MKKNLRELSMLIIGGLLAGCSGSDNGFFGGAGGHGSLYNTPTNLQLSALGANTGVQLLVGNFHGSKYPDMIELTSTGAYYIKNQQGNPWTRTLINATGNEFITGGVASNLQLSAGNTLDLILFSSIGRLRILTNDGTGSFTQSSIASYAATQAALAYAPKLVTNPNAPNNKQGFIVGAATSVAAWMVQQTNLNFGSQQALGSSVQPESGINVLSADLNGDGYTDFVMLPHTGTTAVQFFQNNTDTSLSSAGTLSRSHSTNIDGAAIADIAGDTKPDLLLATDAGIELFVNQGNFSFSENSTLTPLSVPVTGATSLVVQDLNSDRLADLFVTRSGAASMLWVQTSNLQFKDITTDAFGSGVLKSGAIKAYTMDVNADGKPDLIELFADGSIAVHIAL